MVQFSRTCFCHLSLCFTSGFSIISKPESNPMRLCWYHDYAPLSSAVVHSASQVQPVHPKGHQSWVFIGRTDAEAEAPILWPPDVNSWLIGKDPDSGKDWRQEEKGTAEDEVVGWHRGHDGHELEQTLGDSRQQRSLACCSPRACRVGPDLPSAQQQKIKEHNHDTSTISWGLTQALIW